VNIEKKPFVRWLLFFGSVLFLAAAGRPPFAGGINPEAPDTGLRGLPLDGAWEFRQAGKTDWAAAAVPGCVHLDLMRLGLIPDPFYRDNEKKVQWVENEDWEYRKIFEVPAVLFRQPHLELVCCGLDTFARLTLNGRRLGETNNMFRTWRFDLKPFLREGKNELLVLFASPVVKEQALEKTYALKLPGNAPHVRKAPFHFGWDWGPRLVTSGIWRSLMLEAWEAAKVESLQVFQDRLNSRLAALRLRVEIRADSEFSAGIEITVEGPNGQRLEHVAKKVRLKVGMNTMECKLRIRNPAMWWPAGMGGQPLYTFRLNLSRGQTHLDSSSIRTGLRTLILEQKPDPWGTSFRFSANGIPFFAKGGNWIPADVFPPRLTRQKVERMLRDFRSANMNMIRVWGGGVYESPDFYDLCDELGLVVWQDFMFAGQMVPGDSEFLENVRAEAEEVVKALRHHPSLALWCGNNEGEEGWFHWGWKESLPHFVWDDYERIFDVLLPQTVLALDPGRPYWPSSPHSLTPGDPRSPASGDMHYWGVWHGREPFEQYQKIFHRFLSEFGFQSFPLLETVKAYARPEEWNIASPVMEGHQKHPEGNRLILHYLLDRYRQPKDFESLLWLSQVLQAEGMKTAVEHFRSQMPRIMGALYWQLDDCWPVASWSGMDYFGRWKALQYYARRFFSPVLVAPVARDGRLDVFLVSDLRQSLEARLTWSLRTYEGRLVTSQSTVVRIEPGRSLAAFSKPLEELKAGEKDSNAYLHFELQGIKEILSSNIYHFSRLKKVDLPDPEITYSLEAGTGDTLVVRLAAKRFAKDVYLEASGLEGRFEDDFFDLLPGQPRLVRFLGEGKVKLEDFSRALKIQTLRDTY
jgi:beta-mannosidase